MDNQAAPCDRNHPFAIWEIEIPVRLLVFYYFLLHKRWCMFLVRIKGLFRLGKIIIVDQKMHNAVDFPHQYT